MDQTGKEPIPRECDLNQWLESTLGQCGKAEPRSGLENRILASLQAERSRRASRRSWWWTIATTAAFAAIVAAVWVGESGRVRKPVKTAGTSTTPSEEFRGSIQPVPAPRVAHPAKGFPASQVAGRTPVNRGALRDLAASSAPKLEQFPSPRNLSGEELLLVRRLNEQSDNEALLQATATRAEVDLSIDSLEIRPLQIPDIEISESKTN